MNPPRTANPPKLLQVLALVAATLPLAKGQAPRPSPRPGLQAALWVQRSGEYRALCRQAYALARTRLDEALADPAWTAALEQRGAFRSKPPAVVLDLDETVLDNSPYQTRLLRDGRSYDRKSWSAWVREAKARAVPGALEFCRYAVSRGVRVFYLSNRRAENERPTRDNLARLGFPLAEDPSPLLLRTKESDKGPRRGRIAATHRILLAIGDSLGDFHSPLSGEEEKKVRSWFGTRWIVLPNPMYGHWLLALTKGSKNAAERLRAMYAALRSERPEAIPPLPVKDLAEAWWKGEVRNAHAPAGRPRRLAAGPMNAWADMHDALIWVQTQGEARVQIRFWPEGRPRLARLSEEKRTRRTEDLIARFLLTRLTPGTRFRYEVYVDGFPVETAAPPLFRTGADWRYRGDPPEFTFLFGSCLYVNDPLSDRPGKPYGGDLRILETMAREPADLMLWLGDNGYFRESDWSSPAAMRDRYRHVRATAPLQALLARMQNFAVWDDHDYGPNDSDRSFPLKAESLRLLQDYWPAPIRGMPGVPGAFFRFTWADAEFFLLDDRSFRSPNRSPEGPEKTMFGKAQLRWLADSLRSSRATFKFLVNGNQWLNPMVFFEGFAAFRSEQEAFLSLLARERIGGLVFLSGDRHAGELLRVRWKGAAYDWYEFTSSPLSAGADGYEPERDNPARVPGTWITRTRNYGKIRILGGKKDRRLVLSAHDPDGKEIWSHVIPAKSLQAPKK